MLKKLALASGIFLSLSGFLVADELDGKFCGEHEIRDFEVGSFALVCAKVGDDALVSAVTRRIVEGQPDYWFHGIVCDELGWITFGSASPPDYHQITVLAALESLEPASEIGLYASAVCEEIS